MCPPIGRTRPVASRLQKLQTFRSAKNLAKILEKVLASQLQRLYFSRVVSDIVLQNWSIRNRFWEILSSSGFVILRAFLLKIAAIFGTVSLRVTSAVFAQVATP